MAQVSLLTSCIPEHVRVRSLLQGSLLSFFARRAWTLVADYSVERLVPAPSAFPYAHAVPVTAVAGLGLLSVLPSLVDSCWKLKPYGLPGDKHVYVGQGAVGFYD